MRRLILCSTLLALALVPLAAQSTSGWKVRPDRSTSASDPDGAGEIKFTAMGKGFHAVNPAAAVYWHPSNTATGAYSLKGSFTLNKPSSHNNYYGLVFGGSGLDGANQTYLYFLVGQDGSFLVKRRVGDAKTENVVDKTSHAAITKPDASGTSTNTLEVRVGADKVEFVVNGKPVHSMPRADLKTDGIWGIRVNHQLDVTIADIAVMK